MTTDEWVQLAFLMFLAVAVTMMILAYTVKPHIQALRLDRDRWKAEAEGWREMQGTDGNVVEGVRLIPLSQDEAAQGGDFLPVFLHGAATNERQTDDHR